LASTMAVDVHAEATPMQVNFVGEDPVMLLDIRLRASVTLASIITALTAARDNDEPTKCSSPEWASRQAEDGIANFVNIGIQPSVKSSSRSSDIAVGFTTEMPSANPALGHPNQQFESLHFAMLDQNSESLSGKGTSKARGRRSNGLNKSRDEGAPTSAAPEPQTKRTSYATEAVDVVCTTLPEAGSKRMIHVPVTHVGQSLSPPRLATHAAEVCTIQGSVTNSRHSSVDLPCSRATKASSSRYRALDNRKFHPQCLARVSSSPHARSSPCLHMQSRATSANLAGCSSKLSVSDSTFCSQPGQMVGAASIRAEGLRGCPPPQVCLPSCHRGRTIASRIGPTTLYAPETLSSSTNIRSESASSTSSTDTSCSQPSRSYSEPCSAQVREARKNSQELFAAFGHEIRQVAADWHLTRETLAGHIELLGQKCNHRSLQLCELQGFQQQCHQHNTQIANLNAGGH